MQKCVSEIHSNMTERSALEVEQEIEEKNKLRQLKDEEEYDYITVPPDGGYGWVVLVVCFLINLIVDGFLYAFGAISQDLQVHFNCQEWAVSLIISLAYGFYLLSAPVASALCNKYGCRPVGIIGSIISAVAVASSVLSRDIAHMWLLFGVIGGIGMGLVYLPSIVMVGYYFEEKRAIATGIVTAGTGIGSITFGPLSRFLFNYYGWKIGLVILAGILLCCALCCLSMRPLKPIQKRRVIQITQVDDDDNVFPNTEIKATQAAVITPSTEFTLSEPKLKKRSRADSAISAKSRQSIRVDDAVRPLYKEDILYPGDTRDLPEYRSQPDIPTYIQQTTKVPETIEKSRMKAFWDVFLSMTNIDILNDKKMIIICLGNVCSMIAYFTPYIFIVKVATTERKIDETKAVFLLSVIGFSNTVTRFASGWITKLPYLSPLLVNNIGLTVAGIATMFVPLCLTYTHLIIFCIIWGGFIAFHVSLSPVIVCQIVGLDRYSSALGLTLMFRGITSLAAPPLMGAIRDFTNSFDIAFIIGGITFIISALMHFYLMWINHCEKIRSKQMKTIIQVKIDSPASDV